MYLYRKGVFMPRIARLKHAELTYHIISRGNNKLKIFHEDVDYVKYLEILSKYRDKFKFELYNFVLMLNHVHLLLKAEDDISFIMHRINLSYAQYYKFKYKHIGHFWQDRFKSYIVEENSYLLALAKYIETNPMRTLSCISPEDYPYSSYHY